MGAIHVIERVSIEDGEEDAVPLFASADMEPVSSFLDAQPEIDEGAEPWCWRMTVMPTDVALGMLDARVTRVYLDSRRVSHPHASNAIASTASEMDRVAVERACRVIPPAAAARLSLVLAQAVAAERTPTRLPIAAVRDFAIFHAGLREMSDRLGVGEVVLLVRDDMDALQEIEVDLPDGTMCRFLGDGFVKMCDDTGRFRTIEVEHAVEPDGPGGLHERMERMLVADHAREVESIVEAARGLPEAVVARLVEICPSHPDPEPYEDGTYGWRQVVSPVAIRAFADFHRRVGELSDGILHMLPGRGEDNVVATIRLGSEDDLYLSFRSDGLVQGAEMRGGRSRGFTVGSDRLFDRDALLTDVAGWVRARSDMIRAAAEADEGTPPAP